MAYSNFTTETVFENQNTNVICNRIYQYLIDKFTEPTLNTSFCLTGTVSRIIQGAALEDVLVIPFITNDKLIFNYCGNELSKFLGATAVNLTDRVQMSYKDIKFEFWFVSSLGTINTVNNLKVQATGDIPSNIN